MKKTGLVAGAFGALLLGAMGTANAAEVGALECSIDPGMGWVIGSQKTMQCRFTAHDGTISEPYEGTVTKIGIDIGVTGRSTILWNVVAPTSAMRPGALQGLYAGVSAEATAVAGLGANVLVGGSGQTISLQPVSFGSQTGVNVAGGIGAIRLTSVAQPAGPLVSK
jgi:hypothetical protein